jgi:hypothetical protein
MRLEFGARQIAIIALSTALYAVLNWFSAAFQVVPGASLVFPATAVAIVMTMWFGFWGALGAYFGTIIGNFAWGTSVQVSITGGIHDMIEGLIPAAVFYALNLRRDLGDRRSLAAYVVLVVIATGVNALLGNLNYVLWGLQTVDYALTVGIWPWWLADLVAGLVLGIPLLRFLSPFVRRSGLYHRHFFARNGGGDGEGIVERSRA